MVEGQNNLFDLKNT